MFTKTKVLIVVLVTLIIYIYAKHYAKFVDGYHITQTTIDKINLNLLYEKKPIIINESLRNPRQLVWTLFKYSYAFKKEYPLISSRAVKSNAKFSYIFSAHPDATFVNLINPVYSKDFVWVKSSNKGVYTSTTQLEDTKVEYITIKLRPNQVLIIPSHWIVQTNNFTGMTKVDMNDVLSAIYFKIVG